MTKRERDADVTLVELLRWFEAKMETEVALTTTEYRAVTLCWVDAKSKTDLVGLMTMRERDAVLLC